MKTVFAATFITTVRISNQNTKRIEKLDSAASGHILKAAVEVRDWLVLVTGTGNTAAGPQSRTKTRQPYMLLGVLRLSVK